MSKLYEQLNTLALMSPASVRAEWQRLFRKTAPDLCDDLLRRDIAYRLQENVRGGLAPDIERKLARLVASVDDQEAREVLAQSLRPGTQLIREWHGKTHHVLVLETGFLFEERYYSSLTKIAFDITGAEWSGPRFFGLRSRRAQKAVRHG